MRELISRTLMHLALLAGSVAVACFATIGPLLDTGGLNDAVGRALTHPAVREQLSEQLLTGVGPALGDRSGDVVVKVLEDPRFAQLLSGSIEATLEGSGPADTGEAYRDLLGDVGRELGVDPGVLGGLRVEAPTKQATQLSAMVATGRRVFSVAGRLAISGGVGFGFLAVFLSRRRSRMLRSVARWSLSSCLFPGLALVVLPRLLRGRDDLPSVIAAEMVQQSAGRLLGALWVLFALFVAALAASRIAARMEATAWADKEGS